MWVKRSYQEFDSVGIPKGDLIEWIIWEEPQLSRFASYDLVYHFGSQELKVVNPTGKKFFCPKNWIVV